MLFQKKINNTKYFFLNILLLLVSLLVADRLQLDTIKIILFFAFVVAHHVLFIEAFAGLVERNKKKSLGFKSAVKMLLKSVLALSALYILSTEGQNHLLTGVLIYFFQLIILLISIKRV